MEDDLAAEAHGLVKDFDGKRAVDGVSLTVPDRQHQRHPRPQRRGQDDHHPHDARHHRPERRARARLLGHDRPLEAAREVGYLPEERGLYPAMPAAEAIAFMGALRGLPIATGRRRAVELLEARGYGDWAKRPIRTLSKGMAQTVQLLGTIVHRPRLIVLDEPFSGLDALNQEKLEQLIRDQAADGTTVIFSTHVIAHAERLCERVAIIAEGKVAFEGRVDEARDRLRPIVHLRTRADDGPWRAALPAAAQRIGGEWRFELPEGGPEPLLKALLDGDAGIETLSIERPGLHDAFIAIAGAAAARRDGQRRAAQEQAA